MSAGATQCIVALSVLTLILFVSACNPHPFSDPTHQGRDSTSSDGGSKAINTNVINATVVSSPSVIGSLQDKSLAMTKSSKQKLLEQPTYAIQMQPSSFSNRFSSSSSFQLTSSLGTAIKRRSPGADAKSNKSLASIKVSKRDLHSLLHSNKSGDDASKQEMNKYPDPDSSPPPPPLQKGVPASLLDLERSNSGDRIVLKLDREYSPREIADYIYTTGDEKGITQTVWEMLQDGQIMESAEDVIQFFEAVQKELVKMQQEKQNHPKGVSVGRGRAHSRRRVT